MNIQDAIRQKIEQVEAIIAKKNREIAQRDARIAELEAEIADLIHPHDLAAYRAKKTLHK